MARSCGQCRLRSFRSRSAISCSEYRDLRMSEWLIWQLVDSAFPTGAFAHSSGLESAWQHGELRQSADLRRFTHQSVTQTGFGVLPLLNAAYRAPNRLEELDARADTFLLN